MIENKKMETKNFYIYDNDSFITTKENGKMQKLVIEHDNNSYSPREEMSNATIIYTWSKYAIGDNHNFETMQEFFEGLCNELNINKKVLKDKHNTIEELNKTNKILIKRVYLYDHSGISISTSDFGNKFDSGLIGFIFITKETSFKELGASKTNWKEKANNIINAEIEMLNDYLSGNIYSYSLYDMEKCECCGSEKKTLIESVCGFYGNDILNNGMIDYIDGNNNEDLWQKFFKNKEVA